MPQEFSREVAVNDLKELSRMFEEGGRLGFSTLKTVENFLISFLCQCTAVMYTRKETENGVVLSFYTELRQLLFSCLLLFEPQVCCHGFSKVSGYR